MCCAQATQCSSARQKDGPHALNQSSITIWKWCGCTPAASRCGVSIDCLPLGTRAAETGRRTSKLKCRSVRFRRPKCIGGASRSRPDAGSALVRRRLGICSQLLHRRRGLSSVQGFAPDPCRHIPAFRRDAARRPRFGLVKKRGATAPLTRRGRPGPYLAASHRTSRSRLYPSPSGPLAAGVSTARLERTIAAAGARRSAGFRGRFRFSDRGRDRLRSRRPSRPCGFLGSLFL
jgi:hypothetical protein